DVRSAAHCGVAPATVSRQQAAPLKVRCFAVVLAVCTACKSNVSTVSPSTEVRPLVGSGGLGYAVGSIPPGPTLPFGLAKPGPDTAIDGSAPDFAHCAGYWYEDKEVRGFS